MRVMHVIVRALPLPYLQLMIQYPAIAVHQDFLGRVPLPPAVSILLPLHHVFSSGPELQHRLKIALENAGHRLRKNYTDEVAAVVLARLDKLRSQLQGETRHKSVALFASQLHSKLVYLDVPVEESIVIGDTFAIRDIVADAKQLRRYLLLLLSEKGCRFYLAEENHSQLLKTTIPTEVFAYVNEKSQRVANFSDPNERKEIVMDKFLYYMDEELSRILALYPLPVFVLGPEKVLGHFKMHSRHHARIAGYAHGNYVDAGEPELRRIVQPCVAEWQLHKQQALIGQLETAAGYKRLAAGIAQAWAAAVHKNGRLLVVEKSFRFPARRGDTPDLLYRDDFPEDNPFGIPDAVDALIGLVISEGGDVEFVDEGILQEYGRIALIRYY